MTWIHWVVIWQPRRVNRRDRNRSVSISWDCGIPRMVRVCCVPRIVLVDECMMFLCRVVHEKMVASVISVVLRYRSIASLSRIK